LGYINQQWGTNLKLKDRYSLEIVLCP
jgi:hypothetical protein